MLTHCVDSHYLNAMKLLKNHVVDNHATYKTLSPFHKVCKLCKVCEFGAFGVFSINDTMIPKIPRTPKTLNCKRENSSKAQKINIFNIVF